MAGDTKSSFKPETAEEVKCPKCSGLMIPELARDGTFTITLLRCLNCGKMSDPPEPKPTPSLPQ